MNKIRVLVVDDAVVVRRMVSDVLAGDPQIEVVGTAANGKIGLAKVTQVNPDLVTLDVEMPELDGPGMLRELRKSHPKLPVIMFSTLTARGAAATLDALAAGASDYVTKPANVGSVAAAMTRIREELIPKIKALCPRPSATAARMIGAPVAAGEPPPRPTAVNRTGVAPVLFARSPEATEPLRAVVIGVSTGGPNALAEVIPCLPADLGVPVFIVQHMPPVFTRLLAERLDQKSRLSVVEAAEGMAVEPGKVYIAPGDFHLALGRTASGFRVRLNQEAPENSCRPAVDVLFRSAAAAYGPATLAVVLTGMGQDGLRGAQSVREAGGRVLAQDEATSVVWGMPGFVARTGLAERLVPLQEVATEIARRVKERRPVARGAA